MRLYYAPGACSLASHIALNEAGLRFDATKVDLKSKITEAGDSFDGINPKGYVPTLVLDDGEILTENIAVLSWISDHGGLPEPEGPLGAYRLLEMLAFISTELHKSFKPFFTPDASDGERSRASETIGKRLTFLAERLKSDFLFGSAPGAADAYLFVMLLWSGRHGVPLPAALQAFAERMRARPAVALALNREGLG